MSAHSVRRVQEFVFATSSMWMRRTVSGRAVIAVFQCRKSFREAARHCVFEAPPTSSLSQRSAVGATHEGATPRIVRCGTPASMLGWESGSDQPRRDTSSRDYPPV